MLLFISFSSLLHTHAHLSITYQAPVYLSRSPFSISTMSEPPPECWALFLSKYLSRSRVLDLDHVLIFSLVLLVARSLARCSGSIRKLQDCERQHGSQSNRCDAMHDAVGKCAAAALAPTAVRGRARSITRALC